MIRWAVPIEKAAVDISRVGDFSLGWGESLVWDVDRQRLSFVDCAIQTLHWIDDGDDELHTLAMPSMAAGLVPTNDGRLVAALDDGLYLVDPLTGSVELLSRYPDGLGARANDACADLEGNLITGTLNIGPGAGSTWWYSAADGWKLLDDNIANTNGPNVGVIHGEMTLIVGDTSAEYFAYPYDPAAGTVGPRRVFGDTSVVAGAPDGAALDTEGGLWCALFGGRQVVRFTNSGLDQTVALPVENPTDVAFGGPGLDRLYITSIGAPPAEGEPPLDGALLVIDGLGFQGRPEPQFETA
jgi:sugar lactone lactonase YvrE